MAILIAKPALKIVNKAIPIPKTIKTVTPKKSLGFIAKPITPIKVNSSKYNPHKQISTILKPAAKIISKRSEPHKRGVSVRYSSKEVTELDKKKIRELRGIGRGRKLLIIGNGPSINEVDFSKILKSEIIDIMSINKPSNVLWPTKYWLFCDTTQYLRHKDLWQSYEGIIFNTTAIKERKKNSLQIKNIGGSGFSKDLTSGFYVTRSSVYAAMQVALWMDYDNIYIFGCDMTAITINGEQVVHFYEKSQGPNPDVKPTNRIGRFDSEAKHYDFASTILSESDRNRFTFCSSYNKYKFIEKFNRLDHKSAPELILGAQ